MYGPGGPLPAIREAAAAFGRAHGIEVQVTAGPMPQRLAQAKQDAGLIFNGSEVMVSDFIAAVSEQIDPATATPLAQFLAPPDGARIFARWGWTMPDAR